MSDYTTGSAYDTSSDYIVANRDYYTNTVKPGYTAYSYPHPLRAGAGAGGGGGSAPAAPVITSPTTATAKVGTAFTYTIVASNSPTSYSATSLPAGLSVNTSTGLISGTPTAIGTNSVTIGATNAGGSGTATLVIAPTAATTAIQTNLAAAGFGCSVRFGCRGAGQGDPLLNQIAETRLTSLGGRASLA
jgi:hypothetical protein